MHKYIYIYTCIIFLLIGQWVGSIGIFKFSAESRLEFSQRMEKSSIRKSLQDRKSGSFLFSSRSGKMKMTGNLRYLRVTNCKTAGIQPFSTGHSRTFQDIPPSPHVPVRICLYHQIPAPEGTWNRLPSIYNIAMENPLKIHGFHGPWAIS